MAAARERQKVRRVSALPVSGPNMFKVAAVHAAAAIEAGQLVARIAETMFIRVACEPNEYILILIYYTD